MATYDRTAIRTRVLQRLGVLAVSETAATADAALVDDAIVQLHARLTARGLTSRGSDGWGVDSVPDYAFGAYVVMASYDVADEFGVSPDRVTRLALQAAEAERELRRLVALPYSGAVVPVDGVVVEGDSSSGGGFGGTWESL